MDNQSASASNNHLPYHNTQYLAGLLVGIMAVSTASIFIRFAQVEIPSLVIAAGRLTLATLVIAPFAVKRWVKDRVVLDRKTWGLLTVAGLFLGLHFVTWITSLEYTSIASSVVLVTTAPLWVAFLSPIFLKEKISQWVLIGLGIALSGAVIVGVGSSCMFSGGKLVCQGMEEWWSGRNFVGNILALMGAILSGAYLMVGRSVRNRLSLPIYTAIVYGIASIVLIILVILTGTPVGGYSSASYLWVAALALVPQVIGHTAFNWALKYLSATYVSIALLGEPIGTVILAALFLREKPAILEILGGVLILSGIILATRKSMSKANPPV
jgi:drug/metabolite transporter (DMT)-like permease